MSDLRLHLTDKEVARLPLASAGQYVARDTELKGFFVVIGRRKKTFTVQADLRTGSQRRTVKVAVGEVGKVTTREARGLGKGYLAQIAAGVHPRPEVIAAKAKHQAIPTAQTTLRSAWDRYRDGHLARKERSERTIGGYRDHVERIFAAWLDEPLGSLGEQPSLVAAEHDRITAEHGQYSPTARCGRSGPSTITRSKRAWNCRRATR